MINVIAKPAFRSVYGSSSNLLLYEGLKGYENLNIIEFNLKNLFRKIDVFHFHWPDSILAKSFPKLRISLFYALVAFFKLRGVKIVWTVHNVKPHKLDHSESAHKYLMRILIRFCDRFIFPNDTSRIQMLDIYPGIKTKSWTIFMGGWSNDKSREVVEPEPNQYLSFGIMRPYKGLESLIVAHNRLISEGMDLKLIIAGQPHDPNYLKELEDLVVDDTIEIIPRFLPEDELNALFDKCRFAVFPFKQISNSGSVRYTLSNNTLVIVPNIPLFVEMKEYFPDHIHLYENLKDSIEHLFKQEVIGKTPINWKDWTWETCCKRHSELYSELASIHKSL